VRIVNAYIGILKDINNIAILSKKDYFTDDGTDELLIDEFSVTAEQFVRELRNNTDPLKILDNVVNVGRYDTFYSSFAQEIAKYFGLPAPQNTEGDDQGKARGIATLYRNDYDFNPNGGVFDGQAFLDILDEQTLVKDTNFVDGGAKQDGLNGTILLSGITKALRNAVASNVFGNRDRDGDQESGTASDPGDKTNYGTSDGFFDGDVIFIAD
jgi:hypothetical protein